MAQQPDFSLAFRSSPRLLCDVRAIIRSYLTNQGVDNEKVQEVVLAVDEACTNSMRHAYQGREDETLELSLGSRDGWIELELCDDGIPAPYDRIKPKSEEAIAAEALTPGGLGMHLIYNVFDDVTFTPGDAKGNTIVMRLRQA
jgi:anti-sigma regulatory factor (Ser/Thr protein kinase)